MVSGLFELRRNMSFSLSFELMFNIVEMEIESWN